MNKTSTIISTIAIIGLGWGGAWLAFGGARVVADDLSGGNFSGLGDFVSRKIDNVANAISSVSKLSYREYNEQEILPALPIEDLMIRQSSENTTSSISAINQVATVLPAIDDSKITVTIVGDIMMDRAIRKLGQSNGYDSLFSGTAPLLQGSDIVIANLEGPITSNDSKTLLPDGETTDSFTFTFAPESTTALARAGITHVSLANNHSDNFGMDGLKETYKWLGSANIKWFGMPWNAKGQEFVTCQKDICIAMVGYHAFQKGFSNIIDDVKRLSAKGNFVIVMPHWGEEYSSVPTDTMKSQAHELASAGADVVVGAHSHVIGSNEWIGNVPVYYSLGNFLFDQYFSEETKKGLVMRLVISSDGNSTSLDNLKTYEVTNVPGKGVVFSGSL